MSSPRSSSRLSSTRAVPRSPRDVARRRDDRRRARRVASSSRSAPRRRWRGRRATTCRRCWPIRSRRASGVSRVWFFGAFSAALLLMGMLGPAIGRHIDTHGGRERAGGVERACSPPGSSRSAAAQGPVSLALAWVVLGAGMALGLYETAFATLAHLYGARARLPITGITLMAGFASTVGWPLTAALEHAIGWRGACLAGRHCTWCWARRSTRWGCRGARPVARRTPGPPRRRSRAPTSMRRRTRDAAR